MVFFVGIPIVFGFANYLVPLMIGARDMAFPRLNAFSFWTSAFGGLLLYFSFLGGEGLAGAGSAPDVGWFAYAPLTAKAFSKGHSTDYWTIALLVAGFGSIGAAVNIVTTTLCMRCPGMTLGRMPLVVWLNLVSAAMVLIVMTPLAAAQIMLMLDRYLGAHFFDTQAGGSAVLWQHFFWIFGHPEVYVLMLPGFGFASEIIPVFSRKTMFGYPAMVGATVAHRVPRLRRVGASHVHDRDVVGREHVLHDCHDGRRRADGHQDLQLDRDDVGRQDPLRYADALLHRVSLPVPDRRPDGHHAGRRALRLAAQRLVLRRRALPLRAGGRASSSRSSARSTTGFPKATGRMLDETLGKWHFWLFVIGFHLTFDFMHIPGLLGMPRRIYTYEAGRGWEIWNLDRHGGCGVSGGRRARFSCGTSSGRSCKGRLAGNDPWDAWTLEWTTASPPPVYNFATIPVVKSRRPLWDLKHPDDPDWKYE